MWVEIVNGVVGQQVADDSPVVLANGTQYPWNFPKASIPGLVNVVMAATPDPAQFIVTGYTISFVNGTATQVLTTVPVPLAQPQASQIATLRAAAQAAITGGYQSSALGAAHTYPSGVTDQINMLGSVAASMLPGLPAGWTTEFWCADSTGAWSYQPHTAAQIQQVGSDGKAWVITCQTKLVSLSAEVMAATTLAGVLGVGW
jgi:hypothetical protein